MNLKNKQLSYAPADIRPTYCGWAMPLMQQFQDAFKKQIALLCYDEPKSVSDLSEALQTGYEYVQDAVNSLCKEKLLSKTNGKYLTQIPMFHLRKTYEATSVKNQLAWELNLPKKIVELTYALKDELCALDFYGNTFDIKYLNWVFFVMIYNMMQRKLRTYFMDKTDEVVIDDYTWRTQNFDASSMMYYKFADEDPEKDAPKCKQRIDIWSTYYNHIGDIGVYNVYDASPFPKGYDVRQNTLDFETSRNVYINRENISIYLDLVKGLEIEQNDKNKKILEDFENCGVVIKEGNKIIPMIPVIPKDVVKQGEQIVYKSLNPLIQEIVDKIGDKVEKILLPSLGEVKVRKDHFYSFWICDFLNPREELFWYGMNVDGLEIPKDYNKSVAGMWIEV